MTMGGAVGRPYTMPLGAGMQYVALNQPTPLYMTLMQQMPQPETPRPENFAYMTPAEFQNQLTLLYRLISVYMINPDERTYNQILQHRQYLEAVCQNAQRVMPLNISNIGHPAVKFPAVTHGATNLQTSIASTSQRLAHVSISGDASFTADAGNPSMSSSDSSSESMKQSYMSSTNITRASSEVEGESFKTEKERSGQNSPESIEDDWRPDIYANSFTPIWIKNVNEFPATRIDSKEPPTFDIQSYVEGFAGRTVLQYKTFDSFEPPSDVIPAYGDVTAQNYSSAFVKMLNEELIAQQEDLIQYNMFGIQLEPVPNEANLYKLRCPGIREFTPSVRIGDKLYFRQLRQIFNGFEYIGYIWRIARAQGEIFVRIDGLPAFPDIYNAQFTVDRKINSWYLFSICAAHTEMKNDENGFFRKMLFPADDDGVMQTTLPNGTFSLEWFDDGLNYEQQRAIDVVVSRSYGDVPFLISGPPGTGKTKTMVEMALQLVTRDPKCHVLMCAPSDAAADTLALRLRTHLNIRELFRLNEFSRNFAETPIEILSYCSIDSIDGQDMFTLPDLKRLLNYKIVVCTCQAARLLIEARCSNRALMKLERYMMDAFGLSEQRSLHWNALLLDEAGQGMEPETVIALHAVFPDLSYVAQTPVVVMAGDHRQLGPRTLSRGQQESALDKSLFERLMDLPFYSNHPLSRRQMQRRSSSKVAKLPYIRAAFVNLIRNYRSHAALLAVPSSLFYYDTLMAEASNVSELSNWNRLPNPHMPLLFIDNRGADEMVEDGISWFNTSEVNICCEIAKDLVDNMKVKPSDIIVAVPFREQINRIRKKLRKQRLRDIDVGPIETYQGAERRVVIVCTTRARERFLDADYRKGMGMVHEAKRFNVAITRAKELMIIIGNPVLLERDVNWRALLSYCYRNSLFDVSSHQVDGGASAQLRWKPDEDETNVPLYYSRLEHGIVYAQRTRDAVPIPEGHSGEDPMWRAGFAAEEGFLDG
ncbi:P-loop containing nucleoside triphosphate hydrolase protein [Limtongia smithiae]|uniref:P-loop containing nucleoside triphosphate hydrolase protein n=1 Tax=Limtongia smithiae TaxID=1125753 RepID=UPI0034CD27F2